MNDIDDLLDQWLRVGSSITVQDCGFTQSLLRRLRPRQRALPLIVVASTLAGIVLAVIVSIDNGLFAMRSVAFYTDRGTIWLLPLCLVWATCAWAVSESE